MTPSLGPDATVWLGLPIRGARQHRRDLAELRTIEVWFIRFGLAKAGGVAEVAKRQAASSSSTASYSTRGGYRRSASRSREFRHVIRDSNMDVGGGTVEVSRRYRGARPRLHQVHLHLEQIRASRATAACRCCSRTLPVSS